MKDRIKKIRESIPEHGKTQESFAKFLGISKANLSSYESGRRKPSDEVSKLSFYLGQIEGGDDKFIQDLIEVYMELDKDSKKALRIISERMAEKRKNREQN